MSFVTSTVPQMDKTDGRWTTNFAEAQDEPTDSEKLDEYIEMYYNGTDVEKIDINESETLASSCATSCVWKDKK